MDDLLGKTLGQYHLKALLGSGGMGQVYCGIHQLLKRPAAVKVMLAHYATNPQFRARFLQEAQAAAALHHPNIVEIYEFGEQDGILFLVMELVEGGSLNTLLRRLKGQPLPLPLVLDLASQVALGLAVAHSHQVIHRDIKPANLLLERTSGEIAGPNHYLIKINDFGLARLLEGGLETITGSPMGTLAYMSPEQCAGSKRLDGRSDLYSLGVVLYEMVTGYPPFQINGISDAVYKHIHTPPPSPRSLRPDLPSSLEEIILRCLAKQPEERFATGAALASALQNVLGQLARSLPSTLTRGEQQTVLEVPVESTRQPPEVETMPGSSRVPRVRVLNQAGQTLQVMEVRSAGMTLGREKGNDIVLPSPSVSRQHLRIGWDGQRVTATDLGSDNGCILDEVRLLPDAPQIWHERQMLRVGSFWLRLERASAPSSYNGIEFPVREAQQHPPVNLSTVSKTPTSSIAGAPSVSNERIGLSIMPKTISITPGQPATVQVNLTNQGMLVDWFIVTVEGVPAEWVQGTGLEVQLNPGTQETVNLLVNVSRRSSNKAQSYPVVIRARSRQEPKDFSQTNAIWVVEPFQDEALALEPRRASGWGKAKYKVALRNRGNVDYRYALSGDDDEQKLNYHFTTSPLDLEAGQEERVPLQVRTRRRLIGSNQRMPFQVHATSPDESHTQTIAGEFVNRPLLPSWLLAALALLLIVAAVLTHLPQAEHAGTLLGITQGTPSAGSKTNSGVTLPGSKNPGANSPGSGGSAGGGGGGGAGNSAASANVPNVAGDYTGAISATVETVRRTVKSLEIQINQNGATLSGTINKGGTSYSDTGTVDSKGGVHLVIGTTDFFGSLLEPGHLSGSWGPAGSPVSGIWNANTNSAISGDYWGTYTTPSESLALNMQITQNGTSLSGTSNEFGSITGTISNNGSFNMVAGGTINLSGSVLNPGGLAGTWTGNGSGGNWRVNVNMTIAGTYTATLNPGSQSLQIQITQAGSTLGSTIEGVGITDHNAGATNTNGTFQVSAAGNNNTIYALSGSITGAGEISGSYTSTTGGVPGQSGTWDAALA